MSLGERSQRWINTADGGDWFRLAELVAVASVPTQVFVVRRPAAKEYLCPYNTGQGDRASLADIDDVGISPCRPDVAVLW